MFLIIKVVILILLGLAISALVILQPSKDGNGLEGLNGSGAKLFTNTKKRGVEIVLFRATGIFGILFFLAMYLF